VNLIIADSELELVPPEMAKHPQVKESAKIRGKPATEILLDSTNHFKAIFGEQRRGRPDIVHVCLLLALDSLANQQGKLKVFVHTRNDVIIEIHSSTRIPRNYNRFVGLMEQLLLVGKVPPEGTPLMTARKGTLQKLVDELGKKAVIFDENGKTKRIGELHLGDKTVIIGGFPSGDYLSKADGQKVSLGSEQLCAWSAVAYALSSLEL